ncbi:MAG: TolC family protein [Bacteroidales bacterium]|nr:TolC family protein [Bacteroidales bacterium]
MRRSLLLLCLLVWNVAIFSQESWTLDDCIAYAIRNNISVKRAEVSIKQADINLAEQRAARLPSLSLSSSASINYGRSISPEDNIITFDPNFYNRYGFSSSLSLFNGFAQSNRISAFRFLSKMTRFQVEQDKNRVALDVATQYYQVLVSRGVAETAESNYDLAVKQYDRVKAMVEAGREAKALLQEMRSQVSGAQLLLTRARNEEIMAVEELRALLNIKPEESFDIGDRESNLIPVTTPGDTLTEAMYASALQLMPGIEVLRAKRDARGKEFSAARGTLFPSISFYAGWQTTYFNALKSTSGTLPFNEQLKNNNNPYFGLNLSIPLFNRWNNVSNLNRAKLNLTDSEFELEQEIENLRKEISKAVLELEILEQEYYSASENLKFCEESYVAVESKFIVGLANASELAESTNRLLTARIDLLRIALQYSLKSFTMKLYQTGSLVISE